MKRLALLMLILVMALTSCAQPNVDKSSQDQSANIENLVKAKEQLVRVVDLEAYVKTLDPEDKELQTEQTNWMKDIKQNPINDYSLALLKLEQIDAGTYKAELRQQYKRGSQSYKLDYYNKYKVINGKVYDAGNYFDELKKGNVTIKYTAANQKLALEVIDDMNALYDKNIKIWGITPKRPLVVKMFENIEELRQSIKLSMWQCAGWYEYGESVKMLVNKSNSSSDRINTVVNHEMIHMFTVEKSAGNLAYWFSEGLASYYEMPENQKSAENLYRSMNVKLLSIDSLEGIELEKLEDRRAISDYYNNAHLITAFIVEKYGEDKINKILETLGRFPSRSGPTSENDAYYRECLHQAIPEALQIKDYGTFEQQWQKEISML
jgi:hypothetical protein